MYSKLNQGDLLYRSKGLVEHVGVYLGDGWVIHNQPNSGVIITRIEEFANGQLVKVTSIGMNTVLLATRLKEIFQNDRRYLLLEHNCEHLANYLIHGHKTSNQIYSAVFYAMLSGLLGRYLNKGNLLLWLAGGAIAGLAVTNLSRKYDYTVSPLSR